ncbi:hypothetical protein THAOC_13173 [Thalassiosira oceanica]|uniref:Uncharacterized protein n=1 Tax=Thalassiosira oceanica TaxID=159749 RepID=K0SLR5_THAOC|nr:hypothetical protein THAOC_13173 [Thalassiosira oceanica]|eukprot:EJK65929.1 hypothetical protein THAOC_13173 [Thalassiosira oceanica]
MTSAWPLVATVLVFYSGLASSFTPPMGGNGNHATASTTHLGVAAATQYDVVKVDLTDGRDYPYLHRERLHGRRGIGAAAKARPREARAADNQRPDRAHVSGEVPGSDGRRGPAGRHGRPSRRGGEQVVRCYVYDTGQGAGARSGSKEHVRRSGRRCYWGHGRLRERYLSERGQLHPDPHDSHGNGGLFRRRKDWSQPSSGEKTWWGPFTSHSACSLTQTP